MVEFEAVKPNNFLDTGMSQQVITNFAIDSLRRASSDTSSSKDSRNASLRWLSNCPNNPEKIDSSYMYSILYEE
jgi:hypothetical protein